MTKGFIKKGNLYKGNTHLHTTRSDGSMDPEIVFKKYMDRGYSFVVLTDHIRYFNSDRYNTEKFIVLPGVELHVEHDFKNNRDHHVTGLHIPSEGKTFEDGHVFDVPPISGYGIEAAAGRIKILKDNANIVIYAHPVWSRTEPEILMELSGYDAIEIWNHECEYCSNSGNATYHWDYLLKKGRKVNAIACDDRHKEDDRSTGGYIMVQAESLDNMAIAEAIKEGNYYSSTGPEIYEFYIDGGRIYARGSEVKKISFMTNARNKSYSGESVGDSINRAEHKLTGDETYVRLELLDFNGNRAWSNPIYP
jgi:hypothetical protein